MPRCARKHAESGIYHVMLRGNNQQEIFEDIHDRRYFIKSVLYGRSKSEFKLYAYCLMGNHVHLLIHVLGEDLDVIFKRIIGRYVYWYNTKYQRSGHLFQDRFKSEPVENDAYFLTVLRYIHQNPVKAGICKSPEEYPYSSFHEYLGDSHVVDTEFVLSMLTRAEFISFNNAYNDDVCLDIGTSGTGAISDEKVRSAMQEYANCCTVVDFLKLSSEEKKTAIIKLRKCGASVRQLSRLTGVSKGVIEFYTTRTGDGSVS